MSDTMRVHPDLCPKPWVRKLPDYIAPGRTYRWQSFIPDAARQFELHPTQEAALARVQMYQLQRRLAAELDQWRGRSFAAHPSNGEKAVA